jgi:hypothetical protein
VLRRLHARAGDQLVLIAAGGIETADDAWERIAAGATLVQAYTGFIYGGPRWARRIQDGLARRARAEGLKSVSEARGTMVAPLPPSPADDGVPSSAMPSPAEPAQAEPAQTGDAQTGSSQAEPAHAGDPQTGDPQAELPEAGTAPAELSEAQPGDGPEPVAGQPPPNLAGS